MGLIWRAVRRAAVVCGATAGLLAFCLAGFARADGLESGARLTGARGLNTVPDARMDAPGTLRAGVATSDPYLHAAVSAQLAGPLSLTLRQSARLSSLRDAPRALSPAVDVKLRISEEGPIAPALAVGADALFGARATASEYVVASKRFGGFDVTGGLAWGRLGRSGALGNPLGFLDREREGGEEGQSGPGDWLSGRRVGVFAGVAYVPSFAPSLTVKLDWSEDNYAAEKAADPGFDAPAPWSAAVSWRAAKGLEVGVGTVGAEKIMARVNLLGAPEGWGVRPYKTSAPPRLPERPARTNETAMRQMAEANGTDLSGVSLSSDGQTLSARLALDPHRPVALQIGRAARFMAGYGAARAQMLALSLDSAGTRGPVVVLPRGGLERMAAGRASPEEVWRGARIEPSVARLSGVFPATSGRFRWIVQTDLSVSERTAGILHRTALLADFEDFPAGGPMRMGGRVRLNLFGNAQDLPEHAWPQAGAGRGAFGAFSGLRVMPESFYATAAGTLGSAFHAALTTGYLEETAIGTGAEILWRPPEGRLALGVEGWSVLPRDPYTTGALGVAGQSVLTGHLNAWYEWPENDLTFYVRAGRYLAGDVGGTLGVMRAYDNGVELDASVTVTDGAERDADGRAESMAAARMALRVPFGSVPTRWIPQGSQARLIVGPLGRNAGQALDNPAPLYAKTSGFSTGRLARSWAQVAD